MSGWTRSTCALCFSLSLLPQSLSFLNLRCRLSKRQRQLYEEYMHNADTRATLTSGDFLGIMNCLMQLRKASS